MYNLLSNVWMYKTNNDSVWMINKMIWNWGVKVFDEIEAKLTCAEDGILKK